MIIQLDYDRHYVRCFTTIDAAKEYYSKEYKSYNCEILSCKKDEENNSYDLIMRYYNTTDEFLKGYEFIDAIPTK